MNTNLGNQTYVNASPLHKIELQRDIQRNNDENYHRDSIVSFESVATTGRLLDRLGLDEPESEDDEELQSAMERRSSFDSISTTGRLLDRLGLDDEFDDNATIKGFDDDEQLSSTSTRPNSIKYQSTNDHRTPNYQRDGKSAAELAILMGSTINQVKRPTIITQVSQVQPASQTRIEKAYPILEIPESAYQQDDEEDNEVEMISIANSHGGKHSHSLSNPSDMISFSNELMNESSNNSLTKSFNSSFYHATAPVLHNENTNDEDEHILDNGEFNFSTGLSDKHRSLLRTPSAPMMYTKRNDSNDSSMNAHLQTGNKISDILNRERSNSSSPMSVLTPDARVELAIKLRNSGKQREASYQLNIAANQGNENAMLLYGLAIRYGYGVRKDDKNSFIWLCKACKLDFASAINFEFSVDPFTLDKNNTPNKYPEPLAPSLFEIGMAFINGWGVLKNQVQGLKFIEKAGALGYVDAMCQAGTLWSNKGPHRKKDLFRSAAWFRLAEVKGAKSIGNSWIYKEKYMKRK